MKVLLVLVVVLAFLTCTYADEYQWGDCGPKDYLIAKDKVTKKGTFGLVKHQKYVLQQKKMDALTITCVNVTDGKKKCDASAVMENGGIGSKGLTLKFISKRGKCINAVVKVWGR